MADLTATRGERSKTMIKAEYIAHMNQFRIYDESRPQWTMVYADDMEEIKHIAERLGEEVEVVICL